MRSNIPSYLLLLSMSRRLDSFSSEVSSIPSSSHATKLAKPDPISFIGNSGDWSSFSQDFEQLNVPGRDEMTRPQLVFNVSSDWGYSLLKLLKM